MIAATAVISHLRPPRQLASRSLRAHGRRTGQPETISSSTFLAELIQVIGRKIHNQGSELMIVTTYITRCS